MIYAETKTPIALAAKLAEYISDPSTIRARVKDHFGRAPSLEKCSRIRSKIEQTRKPWHGSKFLDDKYTILCAKHNGPYEIDADGNGRCKTCRAEKERAEKERELAHLKRLIALREEKARAAAAASKLGITFTPVTPIKTATDILRENVAAVFSTTSSELAGNSRERHLVAARTAFIRIMRLRGFSYPQIGRALGGRDHSSIINLDHSYETRAKHNALIASTVEALKP